MKRILSALLMLCLLCSCALAAPSPTAAPSSKDTVPVKETVDDLGNTVEEVVDAQGNKINVGFDEVLILTPVIDSDLTPFIDVHDNLTWSRDEILNTEKLSQMPAADLKDGTIGTLVDASLAEQGYTQTMEDLAVSNLFDAKLVGPMEHYLDEAGNYIDIDFELDVKEDSPFIAIYSMDNEGWKLIDPANITYIGDGDVRIRFYELCAIAFLVPAEDIDTTAPDMLEKPMTPVDRVKDASSSDVNTWLAERICGFRDNTNFANS